MVTHRDLRTAENDARSEPWQLQMFRRTLKKQQKLRALLGVIGPLDGQRCLLVTCGDNNGALNWHFKQAGGEWTWVDAEEDSTAQIEAVTGDRVHPMDKHSPALPFPDGTFDVVVSIDVHEHLEAPRALNREIARVLRPGGKAVVTTPNGEPNKLATRIKGWIGMGPEVYGHLVIGYDIPALESQLLEVGLEPYANASYSRFFTEILELLINFAYVKVLARGKAQPGQIAPQTDDALRKVQKTYRLYSVVYPALWLVSRLDALLFFRRGYAVVVAARKAGA